jgi:translation initiation factor 1
MGKKHTQRGPAAPSPQLTHSPFAGLAGTALAPPQQTAAASPAPAAPPPSAAAVGRLILRRETKHRGGKAVVIISGFDALPDFGLAAIAELAKTCKQVLGCGGTVDDGEIVLQGDHAAQVAELLRTKGFRVAGVVS